MGQDKSVPTSDWREIHPGAACLASWLPVYTSMCFLPESLQSGYDVCFFFFQHFSLSSVSQTNSSESELWHAQFWQKVTGVLLWSVSGGCSGLAWRTLCPVSTSSFSSSSSSSQIVFSSSMMPDPSVGRSLRFWQVEVYPHQCGQID